MGIEIRKATPGDYAGAGEVALGAYMDYVPAGEKRQPDFSRADWTEYLSELHDVSSRAAVAEVYVAVDGDAVVGTATLEVESRINSALPPLEAGEAHLRMVAVDPRYRGRGVGKILVERCIRAARELGKTSVTLNTAEGMRSAIRMYEALGFTRGADRDYPSGARLRSYRLDFT